MAFRPTGASGQCNANASKDFCIEQHEPELLLQGARRRGYIDIVAEQQISNHCAKVARGAQGIQR